MSDEESGRMPANRAEARRIADELRGVAAFGLNFARPGSFDAERWELENDERPSAPARCMALIRLFRSMYFSPAAAMRRPRPLPLVFLLAIHHLVTIRQKARLAAAVGSVLLLKDMC